MARVLFINGGLEGHVNPTVGVVGELVRRGEEVVYFTTEPFRGRLEAAGALVHTYDGPSFFEALRAGEVTHLLGLLAGLLRTADVVLPRVLERVGGQHFDYVVHDSMLGCGRLAAQVLGLAAVCSCSTFARSKAVVDAMLDDVAGRTPATTQRRLEEDFARMVGVVEERYGVSIASPYEVYCNPAPLTIVYTSRRFQPDAERFDESYKFVGPSVATRPHDGQLDLSGRDTANLVYVSFGTLMNRAADFYRLCFDAFADAKHTVILSVGRQTQVEELGQAPPNFIVRQYVPQLEVLRHAKVFITHGGMNSTSESLLFGVPLVVLPQGADQPVVARRVAGVGAGVHLEPGGLTAARLREVVERVLADPSMKAVCMEMAQSFRDAGGHPRAVDEIFAHKRIMNLTA